MRISPHAAQRHFQLRGQRCPPQPAGLRRGSHLVAGQAVLRQRVVSARDDAASLAIGSRLNSQVQALRQASVNAGQAVSMLQIADGAMAKVNDVLIRMKTLAVQAGSGQLSDTERGMLNTEYQLLVSEVSRIAAPPSSTASSWSTAR